MNLRSLLLGAPTSAPRLLLLWMLAVVLLVPCFLASRAAAQRLVPGEEDGFPLVQFPDSLYTLNDRCIVRLRRLSVRMPASYVNGLPIGFC